MKKIIINGGGKEDVYNKERHTKEITDLNQLFLEIKTENGEKMKRKPEKGGGPPPHDKNSLSQN